jgi:hypothetical protein
VPQDGREPEPEMGLLHAPVRCGWGVAEWRAWGRTEREQRARVLHPDSSEEELGPESDESYEDYWEQKRAAVDWTKPAAMDVRVQLGEAVEVYRRVPCSRTVGDLVAQFCSQAGVCMARFAWRVQPKLEELRPAPGDTDNSAADSREVWPRTCNRDCIFATPACASSTQSERTIGDALWAPGEDWHDFWATGAYVARLEGKAPTPEPKPQRPITVAEAGGADVQPPPGRGAPLEPLQAMPPTTPDAAAWAKWREAVGCSGMYGYWRARNNAVRWACPSPVHVVVEGAHHTWSSETVDPDAPLIEVMERFVAAHADEGAALPQLQGKIHRVDPKFPS